MHEPSVSRSKPAGMRIALALTCLLAWLLAPFHTPLAGANPMAGFPMALGPRMQVLEDPAGRLSIDQVASPAFAGKFKPNRDKVLKLGLSPSVYWARFALGPGLVPKNVHQDQLVLSVDKAMLNSVKLFSVLPGNTGPVCREIPLSCGPLFEKPPVPCSSYIFQLPADSPPGAWFYFRFHGPEVSLTIPVSLWPRTGLQAHQREMNLALGLLYGTILAMCLYNFFIFLSLRDKTYLYYILWMLGALVWLAGFNGHLLCYLPLAPAVGVKFYYFALGTAIFCEVLFTKSFLNTPKQVPVLNKILTLVGLAALSVIPAGLAGFSYTASILSRALAPIGAPWVLVAAVICWRKGFKSARYLAWAWAISLVGIVCTALVVGGTIPHTALTVNGWAIGTAIESIFLAFALSDRIRILQQEREALKKAGYELHQLSITDELTKLYNARYFSRQLTALASGELASGDRLSCIMLDLDDFKQINDAHGHPEGDKVLERIGQLIKMCIRDSDLGCRYGGEEFAVLLPGSGMTGARRVAERIRRSFADQVFELQSGFRLRATISAGVAELREGEDPREMLRRSDEALYLAKRNGKNRTELAPAMPQPPTGNATAVV